MKKLSKKELINILKATANNITYYIKQKDNYDAYFANCDEENYDECLAAYVSACLNTAINDDASNNNR